MNEFKLAFRMIKKHITDSIELVNADNYSDAGRSITFALLLTIAVSGGLVVRGLALTFRMLDKASRKTLRCYPEC